MGIISKEALKQNLAPYEEFLNKKELSPISIKKYLGDIHRFIKYLEYHQIQQIDSSVTEKYKQSIYTTCSVISCNSYIISLNKYFKYLDMPFLCVKLYKVPSRHSLENVLSIEEYNKLLNFTNNDKYYTSYLIMRTLGCTGMRISELRFVTYEALLNKRVDVMAKSKCRTVYLNEEIYERLIEYCKRERIQSGLIFRTRTSARPLDNGNIWRKMKVIAKRAGVDERKVYPHSFRHLFAKTYIEKFNAIDELADILGHSSIETTRIYTRTTVEEKRERLNLLGL